MKRSFSTRAKQVVTVEGEVPAGPKREKVMLGSPDASTALTVFLNIGPRRSSGSTPSTLLHWSPGSTTFILLIIVSQQFHWRSFIASRDTGKCISTSITEREGCTFLLLLNASSFHGNFSNYLLLHQKIQSISARDISKATSSNF